MRAHLPSYEMVAPKTLKDALARLAGEPGVWRPFAGGTDIMVLFEAGKLAHKRFLSIWGLKELHGIRESAGAIELGALTTFTDLQANAVMRAEFPILCQSSSETGAIAIQNRGTVGGNIANASPAADSSPGFLAYEAEVELISAQGTRRVAYKDFHLGYKKTALRPDELVRAIILPRGREVTHHFFRKVGTRKAQAISKICLAAVHRADGEFRVALGSVGPTPIRCVKTEAALRGAASPADRVRAGRAALAAEIAPIDDIRSTGEYRREVSLNLLEQFLVLCGTG